MGLLSAGDVAKKVYLFGAAATHRVSPETKAILASGRVLAAKPSATLGQRRDLASWMLEEQTWHVQHGLQFAAAYI